MTKEDISIYTRRITQGNKSEIVVVLYDMYFSYEKDVKAAIEAGDDEAKREGLSHMEEVVDHLEESLDFSYDIAGELYSLYDYVKRKLAVVSYKRTGEDLEPASHIMKELKEAFIEVAQEDSSSSAMKNAQTVTAGMTYGRGTLNEVTSADVNRGFLA